MKRILILDDEEDICDVIREELSGLDYEIRSAIRGEDALQWIEKENFDLLIVDMKLPTSVSGQMVMEKFREKVPHGRVLIMSGCPKELIEKETRMAGANGYLLKPDDIHPDIIPAKVAAVLLR